MTGLFTPPWEYIVAFQCLIEGKEPQKAYEKIQEFDTYLKQINMFQKAQQKKEKEEANKAYDEWSKEYDKKNKTPWYFFLIMPAFFISYLLIGIGIVVGEKPDYRMIAAYLSILVISDLAISIMLHSLVVKKYLNKRNSTIAKPSNGDVEH